MQTKLLCLLPLTALVAAVPNAQVTPGPFVNKRDLTQATITVVNSMKEPLSTSIASNAGNPTLIAGGDSLTGTLDAGASATLVMPQDWSGNIALGSSKYPILGNNYPSLIEPGLTNWGANYMLDVDVSYVNGYTVSAICHCNDDNSFLSGCSADLWSMNKCGSGSGEVDEQSFGACSNPTNNGTFTGSAATTFFAPCAGKAYTFPSDNIANNEGTCTSGAVTCCVGTSADGCPSS